MPKEQNNIGDWNDWINREQTEKQKLDRFNAGNKQERKLGDSREQENYGAERQTQTKQEIAEHLNARLLELEQNLKKHLDEMLEQFLKTKKTTGDSGAQAQEQAKDINNQAKQAMDNVAPSVNPWEINPEEISEHLAKIFNSGIVSRTLEKVFPSKVKQSRIKKANQEIGQARKIRDEEDRKQEKLKNKLTKLEKKMKKKEAQVAFQESRLKIERGRTVEPAKREYERLLQEVRRLNVAQYQTYEHPIRKIGNFVKKITAKIQLSQAKNELEKQQERIRPMESNYKISVDDLNNLKANIEHLNQNIKTSLGHVSNLEQKLLRMAGIELPQPQNTTLKEKTAAGNSQENNQESKDNRGEKFRDEMMRLRKLKTEQELDQRIKEINEKYGSDFVREGCQKLKIYNFSRPIDDEKFLFIKAYANQGRFMVEKEIVKREKQYSAQEKQAA